MAQKQNPGVTYDAAHRELMHRVRRRVRLHLPKTATVLVVSKGDPEFLEVGGRQGWHFPQNQDGAYLGYHPTESVEIIAQLETLRARGAHYLLIPRSGFWWLEQCPAFKHYLGNNYQAVIQQEDVCLLFDLRVKIERLPAFHRYLESELSKQLAGLPRTNGWQDWRRVTLVPRTILLSSKVWIKQQVALWPRRLRVWGQSKLPPWQGSLRTFLLEWALLWMQAWQAHTRRNQPGIGQSPTANQRIEQAPDLPWTQPQMPTGNWLHRRAYQVQWRFLQDTPPFFDQAGENVIFLAGSGRSGTTWVQEMINHNDEFRVLFEPFWNQRVPSWPVPIGRAYIRPNQDQPELVQAAQRILHGRLRSKWADRWNHTTIYHRRLIKDIRANLMLKWLQRQMPAMKIVFLMRHPCATTYSQSELDWKAYQRGSLAQSITQPELVADFLQPFLPLLNQTHDSFEQLILLWAVENYVPLRQFGPDEIYLLFYEELCVNPEAELTRLFAFLQMPLPTRLAEVVAHPSRLVRDQSAIKTGESLIDGWRARVSADQVARAVALLGHFGLDQIYSEASMPNPQAAKRMLAGNATGYNFIQSSAHNEEGGRWIQSRVQ